ISRLADYPDLCRLTDNALVRITGLTRESLREAIERPAAEDGVEFSPGLVDEIVADVEGQPADLPLLQCALDALWKHESLADRRLLRRSTYRVTGGVRGSLGERFQKLYDAEGAAGKAAVRALMLRLVTPHPGANPGARAVSRLAPREAFRGKEAELVRKLID